MEFPFDINVILPYEVTILNGDYRILNNGQTARVGASDKLTSIIDAIGEASYKAQGLPSPVTTARKLRISDHRLYLMKNASDHNNLGSIVGLLKVGEKHLYVHDSHGQVHERTPLCLLDFYVHESKQRSGYGKRLFETMLEFEKCNAHDLAIDRPSNKCLAFLHKHYQLSAPIRQVNNFVVFSVFFNRAPMNPNRRVSALRSRHEKDFFNDPFRRHEPTSLLLPSEKQTNRRPFSEQIDVNRAEKPRPTADESESLVGNNNQRRVTNDQQKAHSSYAYQYHQNSLLRDPFKNNKTDAKFRVEEQTTQTTAQYPRTYIELFNENNPFPSLQRYHTNPLISMNKPPLPNPPQNYSYKDYQSSAIPHPRRQIESAPSSGSEPLTSIYTFPSLIKPNQRWQRSNAQPSTVDAASSAWRLFGVHR